jgi:thiol-disulfide isomerase/thioredoxin
MFKGMNMTTESPPAAGPPRYRGLSGAIRYGLFLFSLCLSVSILLGVVLAGLTGMTDLAVRLVGRIAVVALILATAVAFCRWVSGGTADRLLTHRYIRGDLGAFGVLVGLLLAGALSLPTAYPGAGQPVAVAGPTLDGKSFDLAEYRGKVVLVDFWATWCPPCVAELPHLKTAYDRYHADGFEIVSVSLDTDREKLIRFVKGHGFPWPQIFFDEPAKQSWDSPLARQFDVRGIPYSILVDREGNQVASDLRGPLIEQAVAEALGETPWYMRLLGWMIRGLFASDWWLLLLTCWGGALVALLIEISARRLFRRGPKVA